MSCDFIHKTATDYSKHELSLVFVQYMSLLCFFFLISLMKLIRPYAPTGTVRYDDDDDDDERDLVKLA